MGAVEGAVEVEPLPKEPPLVAPMPELMLGDPPGADGQLDEPLPLFPLIGDLIPAVLPEPLPLKPDPAVALERPVPVEDEVLNELPAILVPGSSGAVEFFDIPPRRLLLGSPSPKAPLLACLLQQLHPVKSMPIPHAPAKNARGILPIGLSSPCDSVRARSNPSVPRHRPKCACIGNLSRTDEKSANPSLEVPECQGQCADEGTFGTFGFVGRTKSRESSKAVPSLRGANRTPGPKGVGAAAGAALARRV